MIMLPSDLEIKAFYGAVQYFMFPVPVDVQENGCWIPDCADWAGYKGVRVDGKRVYAHRLSYCLNVEDIPLSPESGEKSSHSMKEGLILHSCDDGRCVRPSHLRKGTAKENTKDIFDRHPTIRDQSHWDKISASLMGHGFSDEARAKMSKSRTGKVQSQETIAKRMATIKRNKELKMLESSNPKNGVYNV